MAKRIGFGQVEPNHLSAQRTSQIYAQLPAAKEIKVLENGQFVKYDYANSEVNFTGAGEWMMVFNEVKLYDDFWRESYKDFAMVAENYTDGTFMLPGFATPLPKPDAADPWDQTDIETGVEHNGLGPFKGSMYPRVIKTNIGDIFTTNCLENPCAARGAEVSTGDFDAATAEDVSNGIFYTVNNKGYLAITESKPATGMVWQLVKVTTMADGQPAAKLMRVQ